MEDFVTYEQSVKLKELGFDWKCNHYYDTSELINECTDSNISNYNNFNGTSFIEEISSAPTLAQAAKWLRTKIDIYVEIFYEKIDIDKKIVDTWRTTINKMSTYYAETLMEKFHSHEEALSAGIDKALKIIEDEQF